MKKKLISIILVVALVLSATTQVFAVDDTNPMSPKNVTRSEQTK